MKIAIDIDSLTTWNPERLRWCSPAAAHARNLEAIAREREALQSAIERADAAPLMKDDWGPVTPPIRQTSWYVDGITGHDHNPGTIELPLKTPAELKRRFGGSALAPLVVPAGMTVKLQNCTFEGPLTVYR